MSEIPTSDNGNMPIQAVYAPQTGVTSTITTAAAASSKVVAALTEGVYRITSTVQVSIARGAFATVAAVAGDATLPALPHVENFAIKAGDGIAVYDAGAGGGTVKITKV